MAPIDELNSGGLGRYLLRVAAIVVLVIVAGAVITLSVDGLCYSAMTRKIPVYPNARVTLEQYNLLRSFGMGQTAMILDSDDSPETVRDWYGKTVSAATRAALDSGDRTFTWANASYAIAGAEDGTGTQIVLNGVCGQ